MNKIDGPARLIVLPDPMNKPVPMAPPIAISCKCRLKDYDGAHLVHEDHSDFDSTFYEYTPVIFSPLAKFKSKDDIAPFAGIF